MNTALWVVLSSAVLSGFFSLVGFSLRQFSHVHLEEAFGGDRGKRKLKILERHIEALRLTISLCKALFYLILVAGVFYYPYGNPQFDWFRVIGSIAVAIGIIAIFGVAIPHAWAAYAGEKVLAVTFYPILFLRFLFYPITAIMQVFDVPIRRLSGASERDDEVNEARQEILQAVEEGQAEGAVDADEVEMIESVIEFGETSAGEIMTPRTDIFALRADIPWEEMVNKVRQAGHTRVPVYEGDIDNIVGLLYAKDLLKYFNGNRPIDIKSFLRKPYFVPESKKLDDLLREFKAKKVHLAVVLDEYGGTAGIISLEDIIEEIVGKIDDEYDKAVPALMKRIDGKTAEVDGRMTIDDINDAMGISLPEDENYETVAGLVFSELGYIPAAGEKLEINGTKISVISADERRITRLKIERMEKTKQK